MSHLLSLFYFHFPLAACYVYIYFFLVELNKYLRSSHSVSFWQVPPFLVRKVFTQIFSFINVQLFNRLVLFHFQCFGIVYCFSNQNYRLISMLIFLIVFS